MLEFAVSLDRRCTASGSKALPRSGSQGTAQCAPRLVQLRFRITQTATFLRCDLAVLKTLDIMKEEDIAVTGRQCIKSPFNGYAVHSTGLLAIPSSKTTPHVFLGDVCHHLIE